MEPTNEIREMVLDRLKVASQATLSAQLVYDADVRIKVVDALTQDLAVQLSTYVYAENLGEKDETVEFEFPATVWEHFKRDHAPRWFLRRWPVRYDKKTVTVNVRSMATFPNNTRVYPKGLGRTVYQAMTVRDKYGPQRFDGNPDVPEFE